MIKVIARSTLKEGTFEKALILYKELIEKTRQEEGCISYELFQSVYDENKITLIEEWVNKDALEMHTKTEHFITIVNKLSEYEIEEPVLIYEKLL